MPRPARPRPLRSRQVPRCQHHDRIDGRAVICDRVAHAEIRPRDRVAGDDAGDDAAAPDGPATRVCIRHTPAVLDLSERGGRAVVMTFLVYVRDRRAEAHAGGVLWQLHRVAHTDPVQLRLM